MHVIELLKSAIMGIRGNKLRASLTMFGIIVGISSVIMIQSLGQGVKNAISSDVDSMGANNVRLYVESEDEPIYEWEQLSSKDIALLQEYPDVLQISATKQVFYSEAIETANKEKVLDITLMGCDEAKFQMQKFKLKSGRFLTKNDVDNHFPSVLVDEDFSTHVLGLKDPLGYRFPITTPFGIAKATVVGVLESTNATRMAAQFNQPATIYAPYTFAQEYSYNPELDRLDIKIVDKARFDQISGNIVKILDMHHDTKEKYKVVDSAGGFDGATVIAVFTTFLALVASISLLVGGIGVMNIMLVSVTERTREIGIRKSLGATDANISMQFLIESIILTSIGGFIGLGLGMLLGALASSVISSMSGMDIVATVDQGSVLLVTVLSSMIGIIFGVYPARKAAKLDPVESLRFE